MIDSRGLDSSHGVVLVDQTGWGAVRVSGADRMRFLQGMCMGNVEAVPEGGWLRTATLNIKGRLLSIFDLVRRTGDILLLCQPGLADATAELFSRHAIADDVAFERADLAVHRVWDSPAAVWDAPPVFAPPPGAPASAEAVEVRRIEAGLPLWGVDASEDHFPFETPLARLIDYQKGCFIGQEPLARVRARGTPNQVLRGLRLGGPLPARGARIHHPARDDAGQVTSAALSPAFGPIALGYLHRQTWEPGGQVTIDGHPAEVVELPFG
ncbi:MAG TPA: glycine cleavage T C-terminal barrel domain-containing protein [Kofleriaceae bacterium]|nr:glycine cleavage T C-terminal barrel domain-containing protein [Kofleriaceae bacterium]